MRRQLVAQSVWLDIVAERHFKRTGQPFGGSPDATLKTTAQKRDVAPEILEAASCCPLSTGAP